MAEQSFLTGLLQGFGDQQNKNRDRAEKRELKELQLKHLKSQIAAEDAQLAFQTKQRASRSQLTDMLVGQPQEEGFGTVLPQGEGAGVPGQSLTDILASPEGQALFLQSGGTIPQLQKQTRQTAEDQQFANFFGGGDGEGGVDLSQFSPPSVAAAKAAKDFGLLKGSRTGQTTIDAPGGPEVITFDKDRPGSTTTIGKAPPSEARIKRTDFAKKTVRSLKNVEDALTSMGPASFSNMQGVGGVGGYFPGWAQTGPQQRLRVSGQEWIKSILRPESGAVIGEEEEAGYFDTYFPSFNEKDETIALKASMRAAVTQAADASANGLTKDELSNFAKTMTTGAGGLQVIGVTNEGRPIYQDAQGKQWIDQ